MTESKKTERRQDLEVWVKDGMERLGESATEAMERFERWLETKEFEIAPTRCRATRGGERCKDPATTHWLHKGKKYPVCNPCRTGLMNTQRRRAGGE